MAEAPVRIAPTLTATRTHGLRSLVTPMCSSEAAAAQSSALRLPELASPHWALTVQQRFRERLSATQLGFACAWRCRAQEHPAGTRLSIGSSNKRP